MNIKPENLKNGNVLVKLRKQNDRIKLKNGTELFVDTFFNEMQHMNIVADVISVPEYDIIFDENNEPVKIPIEMQPGDVAYCYYLQVAEALRMKRQKKVVPNPHGRMITEGDDVYVLLRYHSGFFMVIRNEVPIMVNDYLLVEPTYKELEEAEEQVSKSGLYLPETTIEKHKGNTQWGIVKVVGRNISHEHDPNMFSDEQLKVGTKVFFSKNADIPLEYEYHKTFMPDKTLFRIRRKDILYVEN